MLPQEAPASSRQQSSWIFFTPHTLGSSTPSLQNLSKLAETFFEAPQRQSNAFRLLVLVRVAPVAVAGRTLLGGWDVPVQSQAQKVSGIPRIY